MTERTSSDSTFHFVQLDSRRRVNLARIARPEHTSFIAHVEPDGTIILEPGFVVRASEMKP